MLLPKEIQDAARPLDVGGPAIGLLELAAPERLGTVGVTRVDELDQPPEPGTVASMNV